MAGISKSSLKRIAEATIRTERTRIGTTPIKRRAYTPQSEGFWARITQHEFDEDVKYRYSWAKIRINEDDELEGMGQQWQVPSLYVTAKTPVRRGSGYLGKLLVSVKWRLTTRQRDRSDRLVAPRRVAWRHIVV